MARSRPSRRRPTRRGPPPRWHRFVRVLAAAAGAALLVGALVLAWLWPRCSGDDCPSVATLRTRQPPQASQLLDRHGRVVAYLAPERRTVVPLARIPTHVAHAFLAVEDKRFYRHHGVDYRRVAGALLRNLSHLRYDQGFSTVTMQLARNAFPEHLSRQKTLRRKLWEVVLARRIERVYSKDEILEMYLNQIYLGQGLYGVEAASRGYFNKPVSRLTVAEAAVLAALPKAPSYYDPRRNPQAALRRRGLVLRLMADAGVVSRTDADEAMSVPLGLAPPPEAGGEAPYFVAAVRRELRARFGTDVETRGLRVFTTLDRDLQGAGERELLRQIHAVEGGRHGRFRGGECTPAAPGGCLQGMFLAMDPRTGDVLSLVGGRDYALSQFDRATQAHRQAGSAFKPIVFATALQQGIPISTPLVGPDAVTSEGTYQPRDHVADDANLDLREALRLSSNRAAVALGERVGAGSVVETAKALGITSPIRPYPSTFLGAADVIPMELVAAYAPFANGGYAVRPRLVRRVEDADGQVLWDEGVQRRYAISPGVAYLSTSLMRDVVDRGTGSGVRAAGLPYEVPAAGKTGTTNEGADVWFVGYTPDLLAGVWLGFDRPRAILGSASGGGLAAPVWGRVVAGYYQSHAVPLPWPVPSDLVVARIDRASGLLAGPGCPDQVVEEYFVTGSAPTESCPTQADDLGGWLGRAVRDVGDWLGGGDREPPPRPEPSEPPR
jgi:penicillin-binding protein 1A